MRTLPATGLSTESVDVRKVAVGQVAVAVAVVEFRRVQQDAEEDQEGQISRRRQVERKNPFEQKIEQQQVGTPSVEHDGLGGAFFRRAGFAPPKPLILAHQVDPAVRDRLSLKLFFSVGLFPNHQAFNEAIAEAEQHGPEMLFAVINSPSSFGYTALTQASAYGYTDMVRQLLLKGALVNHQDGTGHVRAREGGKRCDVLGGCACASHIYPFHTVRPPFRVRFTTLA